MQKSSVYMVTTKPKAHAFMTSLQQLACFMTSLQQLIHFHIGLLLNSRLSVLEIITLPSYHGENLLPFPFHDHLKENAEVHINIDSVKKGLNASVPSPYRSVDSIRHTSEPSYPWTVTGGRIWHQIDT